ncbi:uncharacterized protein LOC104897155 [Beta vulgaris subsp. vulgaris]|uniref:uncharacterized protein LOC104897155 n=1 Tax=Beta vulgaris subsp. vulgaris TaxID=3555 RepID=UPI0020371207|nr:uncharacterized protein LOC104897155 [Beta vulgaris subsp. vulgaris]
MADKNNSNHPLSLILYLTFSLLISTSIADLSLRNLESAIFALQANGFDLFGNSIAVSDLSIQILSHKYNSTSVNNSVGRHGFTFLAPPNSVLFSLDMSTDAFTYVHSLRFHVVPRRLTFAELRNVSLSSNPYLETLAPGHVVFVTSSGRRFVAIDGVRVSSPDLYLRSEVVVHGLDGILVSSNEEFFHRLDSIFVPPSIRSPSPAPTIDAFSPQILGFPPKTVDFSPQIVGFPAFSPKIDGISAPINAYSPEIVDTVPFPTEFGVMPTFSPKIDGIPVPNNVFWPRIPENWSPISDYSSEISAIPVSHDVAFTGGSFNSISVPPTHAHSPYDERIPAPSPTLYFLSPTKYSIPPVYPDWSHSDFLSPNIWSPIWSAPPPPHTVGEWQENWESANRKAKNEKRAKMKHHRHGIHKKA